MSLRRARTLFVLAIAAPVFACHRETPSPTASARATTRTPPTLAPTNAAPANAPHVATPPSAAPENDTVRAYLAEHRLADAADHALLDADGDHRQDVVHAGGIALQQAAGWTEVPRTLRDGCDTAPGIGVPFTSAQGALFAFTARARDPVPAGQKPRERMCVGYFVLEAGALRELYETRFDEDAPTGGLRAPTLTAIDGETLRESVGTFARVLRWSGGTLQPSSCWSPSFPNATTPPVVAGCIGKPRAPFRVQFAEGVLGGAGPEMRSGTPVDILDAGTVRRGDARSYCGRTVGADPGWVFLTQTELAGCAALR